MSLFVFGLSILFIQFTTEQVMKSSFPALIPLFLLIVFSCTKQQPPFLEISSDSFSLSGEPQTFTLDISSNSSWTVKTPGWITADQLAGEGSSQIHLFIQESLFDSKEGIIYLTGGDHKTLSIHVEQSPVYLVSENPILVYSAKGYSDLIEVYADTCSVNVNTNIIDKKYEERRRSVELQKSAELYKINFESDDILISPGFYLSVNGEMVPINGNDNFMKHGFYIETSLESRAKVRSLPRNEILSLIRQSSIHRVMLATWPGRSDIRCFFVLDNNDLRFILGNPQGYEEENWMTCSFLDFEPAPGYPEVLRYEYELCRDRFDGRRFEDEEGNLYQINITTRSLPDIKAADRELLQKMIFQQTTESTIFPIAEILKNGEVFQEEIICMYVESMGESLNTGDLVYATSFESVITEKWRMPQVGF